jgi:Phage integrase family
MAFNCAPLASGSESFGAEVTMPGPRPAASAWSNRHTFASWLVMAGVDLRTVQQLGSWQSLAMVQRYRHLAPDHLRAAVGRLVLSSERVELGQNLVSTVGAAAVDRRGGVQHTDTVTRRGGRARLKASDSKSDRGASPSGVQILSPPPI